MCDFEEKHNLPASDPNPPKPVGRPPRDGEAAKGHVHIRTTLARKSAWVRAARPRPLAEWITEALDKAAKDQQKGTNEH